MLTSTKKLILMSALLISALSFTFDSAQAQSITSPISFSGGDANLIYDSSIPNGTTGTTVVGLGDYAFTVNYSGAGSIASNLVISTAEGNSYQLGALSADSGARTDFGPVELTLNTPAIYKNIGFLVSGANGGGTVDYTLNFDDGSTFSGAFTVSDWYSSTTPTSGNNSPGFTLVNTGSGGPIGKPLDGAFSSSLYMYDFTTGALPTTSALDSIDLSQVSGSQIGVFAISGAPLVAPEPSTNMLMILGISLMIGTTYLRRRSS